MLSVHLIVFFFLSFVSEKIGSAFAKDSFIYSKVNKTFHFPKFRPEIFYDNKVLPEDIEVDVYVFKDQLQRVFYMLEGGYRPLSVTVTPCSLVPVEWRLSHQQFPGNAASASVTVYHKEPWYNQVIHPQQISSSSPSASYSGTHRRSYTNPRAPPGLYTLELLCASTVRVKIIATTRSCTETSYHPSLPRENSVQVLKVKRNRVLISWKPSTIRKPLQYCVTANVLNNYNSFCAATSDLQGEHYVWPPAGAGFGFHWEKNPKRNIVHNSPNISKNKTMLTCVGHKTWHLFRGLERGKVYFFDVFVVELENNASTAYVGAKALVKGASRPSWVKDDSLVTLTLDNSNGYSIAVKYQLLKNFGPILLFVQSCSGPGPVFLSVTTVGSKEKQQEILFDSIMDVKTIEVPHQLLASNISNHYTFTLRSSTKNVRNVRMWISGKKHSFPFPVLPADKNVKVFDTLTSCNSITIVWKASPDERVKYCIYIIAKNTTTSQNFCEPTSYSDSDRKTISCRRYHRFSKRRFNNVIMQRVKGLEPDTAYLFEVQVTKVKGKTLAYERVMGTTRKTCLHNSH